MLVSLRASERGSLREAVGVRQLEDLPLYDLTVDLDPDSGTFTLQEELWFTNTESQALDELHLRIYGNDEPEPGAPPPRAPGITMTTGQCADQVCSIAVRSPSLLVVRPSKAIPPQGRLRVRLSLSGVLERRSQTETGLLAQSIASLGALGGAKEDTDYGLLSVCEGFASLANFYAVLARRRDGNWENPEAEAFGDSGPDDLSHVRARILVPGLTRVMTPGVVAQESLLPKRESRPPQRRYDIAAAAVRNFAVFAGEGIEVAQRSAGDVTLRSWFREGNRQPALRALDVAEKSLGVFEKRFGRYPWADLDVVEAPLVGGAGGVEFTGLIALAGMLYRPFEPDDPLARLLPLLGVDMAASVSAVLDSSLEFTTAHEVAHQWWYGLVGSDSRAHPFVDESLAQFSTILYLEDRYGAARAAKDADANVRMNYVAMRVFGEKDAPVDRPVSAFATPVSYAGIVYGKGPYVYRELRKTLGDPRFFGALRAYAERYRFRIAPGRGPIEDLASGPDGAKVRAVARRWLDETHGDADLGPIDLQSMFSSVLGTDAAGAMPAVEELMKFLEPEGGSGSGK